MLDPELVSALYVPVGALGLTLCVGYLIFRYLQTRSKKRGALGQERSDLDRRLQAEVDIMEEQRRVPPSNPASPPGGVIDQNAPHPPI